MAPELEAIVLACLSKQPEQSAAELRSRLEACDIAPWGAASAKNWWAANEARLEGGSARITGHTKTIAVAAHRAA